MQLARIRTVFTGVAGSPWYSNMYFDADAASGEDYIPGVHQFWTDQANFIAAAVDWIVEGEYAVIEDSTGNIVDVGDGDSLAGGGTQATETLPWANQALVNWNTGQYINGRQLRGKTFIPGLTQVSNVNGSLNPSHQASLQQRADELISDGNGAFRIYSPTHLTSAPVTGRNVPTLISVLRSRRD
jgi:hypothetical protein